jgi:hypothetical protein
MRALAVAESVEQDAEGAREDSLGDSGGESCRGRARTSPRFLQGRFAGRGVATDEPEKFVSLESLIESERKASAVARGYDHAQNGRNAD